jgi:ABC-type phosphate transport system substrate-binding protein
VPTERRFFSKLRLVQVACAAVALACTAVVQAEDDENVISGAGAHFPWIIFDTLKDDLQRLVTKKIVLYGKNSMLGQGCNAAVKMAKQNTPKHETFGFVCCKISDEEIKREGLTVYPLALEPLAIMLNKVNPVANLTDSQVKAIFAGKVRNWNEVGGEDRPIVVITRLHCKDRETDWKHILPTDKEFAAERVDVSSDDDLIKRVSDFPGAIGYSGTTWAREPALAVKSITVGGIAPTADNLKQKKYPYYRSLSAVTNTTPSSDVLKIIREVQSGKTFRIAAKQYELLPVHTE